MLTLGAVLNRIVSLRQTVSCAAEFDHRTGYALVERLFAVPIGERRASRLAQPFRSGDHFTANKVLSVSGAVGFDVGALMVAVDVESADALRGASLNVALTQAGRGRRGVDAKEHPGLRRHNRLRARPVDLSERGDLAAVG